jgi:hypothetical protein
MTKSKKEKNPKTVFAIINLANTSEQQKIVARFAAQMAKTLGLDVVLYPQIDEIQISFEEGVRRAMLMASKINGVRVRVAKEQIKMSAFFKPATIFRSSKPLDTIAAKEHAEFIIMGRKEDIAISSKVNKHFGKAMWDIAENSNIPIMLIPLQAEFNPFKRITIAMDKERKLQKMTAVRLFAKTFGSVVNIFLENVSDPTTELTNEIMLNHVKKGLGADGIPYKVTKARNQKDFAEHLCNIAAKRSDLLLIEVEPGKIDNIVKKNIETLLNVNQHFPVLFVKTQPLGNASGFNG